MIANDLLPMDLADFGSPETLIGVILKYHLDIPGGILVEATIASVCTAEIALYRRSSVRGRARRTAYCAEIGRPG